MASARVVARVLLDSPLPQLDRLLDYRVPGRLLHDAVPGVRVTMPLRSASRIAQGFIVEVTDDADYEGTLSELDSVVSPARVLTPQIATLARRVADRAAGGASDILRLAIPPRMVRVEKAWLAARATDADTDAAAAAPPSPPPLPPPPPIDGYPAGALESAVSGSGRIALGAIPRLVRLDDTTWVGQWAVTLARAAAHCIASGRTAIVAVPDFRDQNQLQAALSAILPAEQLVRLDARQTNPQRYAEFLRTLEPTPRVIIGNRSVVYSPAHHLGLIAVWDDGDPLHNEPLAPYATTRDAALVRRELEGCGLILAGHTRSVEAQRLVELDWLQAIEPAPAVSPRVVVTSRQDSDSGSARAARIPSTAWRVASDALEAGPVLVQVARPGYAPVLACARCHEAARCRRCEGPLGLASAQGRPTCGWCGAIATDWHCENCEFDRMRLVSRGAGRTAEELGRAFPGTRVIVADGDHPVIAVDSKPAIVIATRGAEPIAAGGYAAILLLDGERMLARESLRIGDDCLRWWSNAAAFAAPKATVVLAGVDGGVATALATWRHDRYAHDQLADRRELRFPPAVRIATVTGRSEAVARAVDDLDPTTVLDVLGPVPIAAGTVRSIVRFDYAHGLAVASQLRASVIRAATSSRRNPKVQKGHRSPPTLRVRLDDPEIL